jgi:uncharacterized repeat protein (TIGR03803 family)
MNLRSSKTIFFLFAVCATTAITVPAYADCSAASPCFKTILSFDSTNGANPSFISLVQGLDGNLWGTTFNGGANGDGTVFEVTLTGTLTAYSFESKDGALPYAGLLLATNGNFYGEAAEGGANNDGTVFEKTPSGSPTALHSFDVTDGRYADARLVQATDGNFYGTTYEGGSHDYGTVFKITPSGTRTTLYNFCSTAGCSDGANPFAGLVQATDGNFYGTTYAGGAHNYGTVFELSPKPSGDCPSGSNTGNNWCETVRLSFDGTDGASLYPGIAGLIQGTDGNFYGTTYAGGAHNYGTVFKITPSGTLTTLYNFCSTTGCSDGANPQGGLVQDSNGSFYGVTYVGGANNEGTVFSLSVDLGPFVETLPTFGIQGAKINILGQGFTSSSIVTFGGVKATSVSLNGSTDLIAEVPAGALTGEVTVTTGATTLKSNQTFRVTPQVESFSPSSGPVGESVTITGTDLTQTTEVTFGEVKATTFEVKSASEVTATVPSVAKTGKIAVTTPGGSATSTTTFTVTE